MQLTIISITDCLQKKQCRSQFPFSQGDVSKCLFFFARPTAQNIFRLRSYVTKKITSEHFLLSTTFSSKQENKKKGGDPRQLCTPRFKFKGIQTANVDEDVIVALDALKYELRSN